MANAYSSNGPADRSYVKKAMKAPMLEAEHELELARRWREEEDEKAAKETRRTRRMKMKSGQGGFRRQTRQSDGTKQ